MPGKLVIALVAVSGLLLVTLPSAATQNQSKGSNPQLEQRQHGATGQALPERSLQRIQQEVRHQLVMLPYYSLFDDLAYSVAPDGTVTLMGNVVRPTLKSDAEAAVKHIEGVERVNNEIKVLPLSSFDDQIRRAEFRAIYGEPALNRYALQAVPSIHIIVDNGHVTLTGVVATESDKNIAGIRANSVPNVFKVTNDLRVENQSQGR